MKWFPRLLGVATITFGLAVTVRPKLLASPCGLTDARGRLAGDVAVLCRGIGIRDVLSGLAMTAAHSTPALRRAIAVRIAADLGDAALFGTLLPDTRARGKAAAAAMTWASLCALGMAAARGR
ncbi:hypothetical protein [Haloactinomyces albus]|uniref:DUF4267 domain-containing protein n=1 Tax=Haloactinomyces albus TaxID=1352928 RepID=A0AAE3ZI89_9ACTN|nr:hypothetical protein [Haloactinomyces albus]MDR7304145.1 hypothetical protein [Haloactinomyces albus]